MERPRGFAVVDALLRLRHRKSSAAPARVIRKAAIPCAGRNECVNAMPWGGRHAQYTTGWTAPSSSSSRTCGPTGSATGLYVWLAMPVSRSTALIVGVIAGVVLVAGAFVFGVRATRYRPAAVSLRNAVGDATCLTCHQDKRTFETTAHRITSRTPVAASFTGSFRPGENVLRTSNPHLYFRMDSAAGGFFQTAVFGAAPDTTVRTERIAFVTGSGRRGQSFLYWRGENLLYQLPVSYWAMLGWGNSPAYPDGRPDFDRPIPPRCLECHTTAFERDSASGDVHRYKKDSVILGISCETCHGAGREHAERERSFTRMVLPAAIVNPARLRRERQLDGCALCHGGAVPLTTTPFTHVPGTPVEKEVDLEIWRRPPSPTVDVHGDQIGLLARSRCFQQTEMTCSTCHNVHREQRDPVALSGNCLKCHAVQNCDLFPARGQALEGKCVDCHMPVQPSRSVIANQLGQQVRQPVRSHWIKVYPELR